MAPPDRAETVRPGRPADRAALTRIQEALAEPSPALLSAALDATGTDGPLVVLVRVTGGDPVGYTVAVAGPSVYVPELAVDPAHHREGHGSALVAALRERFDARELRLTVAVTDDRARAFYRSQGFERVDRLPDHFESGDALVLVLSR
jgi:ribosomal-protein-alanine N-acetyltransferase